MDEFTEERGVGTKGETVRDVGAGDVEFDGVDDGFFGDFARSGDVVVHGVARDVSDDGQAEFFQKRDFVVEECIQAYVGKSDRVDHAGPCFDDAVCGVTGPDFVGNGFGNKCAELGNIDEVFVLVSVAACSRAGHRGILELQTGEIDRKRGEIG